MTRRFGIGLLRCAATPALIGLALSVLIALAGTGSVNGVRTEMVGQVNDLFFTSPGSQTVQVAFWNDTGSEINAGRAPSPTCKAGKIDACVLGDTGVIHLYDCKSAVCVPCIELRPDQQMIVSAETRSFVVYCSSTSQPATHIVEIVDRAMNRVIGTVKVHVGYGPGFATCFVHTATAGNTNGHLTHISNPSTNGNPSARLLVTPNLTPNGVAAAADYHPIGIWYNGFQWSIYNEDLKPMPEGAAFNVRVLSDQDKCAPLVSASNLQDYGWVFFGNANDPEPVTDYNWNAPILITHNWNPPNLPGKEYYPHYTGVWYHNKTGVDGNPPLDWHWFVFQPGVGALTGDAEVSVPAGLAFNTVVMGWPGVPGRPNNNVWHETKDAGNSLPPTFRFDPESGWPGSIFEVGGFFIEAGRGDPGAKIFVTMVGNPHDASGVEPGYGGFQGPIVVEYFADRGQWAITTKGAMPVGAAFNVVWWQ